MNKFSAGIFVNIGSSLQWFSDLVDKGEWTQKHADAGENFGESIAERLRSIGCEISAQAAQRFAQDMPWPELAADRKRITDVKPRAKELQHVIFDEMRAHLFFWVPPERAKFYEFPADVNKWDDTEKVIDGSISTHFKRAATEILNARKAYAVGQFTPCVFHLMRACEVGIKALYKSLGLALPALSDSWGNMLKPMDKQLSIKPADRHGDWATHPDFFDHATNDVRAIKRAWRDTTMHVESDYNEGEALKALNAVTSFFAHLSDKVNQDGVIH